MNYSALLIGAMVAIVVVLAFDRAFGSDASQIQRRARNVFAVCAAAFAYYILDQNVVVLREVELKILFAIIGILLAFLIFLRRQF